MPCVLLHDVDTATLDQLRAQLPPSHELIRVQDAPEGLKVSAQLLVVTERTLDDADGAVGELHDARPGAPLVVLAPLGRMDLAVRAMRAGAFDVLPDPVDARLLGITVERAVEQGALLQELRRYRAERTRGQKGGLLGNSPAMRQVDRLIDRMAPVASSVLITGESGTGKELVARALHDRSPRASAPFVAINCAAVPEPLLESELFGHVKGAFTDARQSRDGLFVQARGGTLFLDEIGDLPAALQPKLLRVLQDRKVRPVGGDREVALDVRILAATHQDLETRAEAGQFRADLLYRLDVLRIELPPLRERGHDILILAQRFLEQHAATMGRPTPALPPEVARVLLEHSWPGNVRELQNAMERAAALADGDRITVSDLPPRLQRAAPRRDRPLEPSGPLRTLAEVERDYVLRVLDAVSGQRAKAAEILGLDRKTLWRKLRAWGFEGT